MAIAFYLSIPLLMGTELPPPFGSCLYATMNMNAQISLRNSAFNSFNTQKLNCWITVILFYVLETSILFSIAAASFYIPTNSSQESTFSTSPTICYFLFFILIVAILMRVMWHHSKFLFLFKTMSNE